MLTTSRLVANYSRMKNRHQQVLQLLGLAKRAGQLTSGEQEVLKAIRNGKTFLVFVASDIGGATKKKVLDKCRYYQVHYSMRYQAAELSTAIGAQRKLLAVTQQGFANKMTSLLEND